MRKLYTVLVELAARRAYPGYQHVGILYVRRSESDPYSIDYLVAERVRDTDVIFHPVQRWLKGIIDEREQLIRENKDLKTEMEHDHDDGK